MKKISEAIFDNKKMKQLVTKCLYMILVLIISVLFLNVMLQDRDGRDSIISPEGVGEYSDSAKTDDEIRLENILSCISGVGEVQVMIKNSSEKSRSVFSSSDSDDSSAVGVIVVAGGAAEISVKSRIVDAVSTVCGISPSDVIVFEMENKNQAAEESAAN